MNLLEKLMTILKYLAVSCLFLVFISCLKNPEATLQNERIKDLQERNTYILDIVKDQNEKISELEERINIIEKKPIKKFRGLKKNMPINDTINLKIFEGQVLPK